MGNFGIISSIESLPIPEGPHVKDFDATQKAAKIAGRAAKKAAAEAGTASKSVRKEKPRSRPKGEGTFTSLCRSATVVG
jgi:hypothetical protein